MRYCEGEFLEVAQRHGLCRPSNSVLTLKDILELHASVVSVSRYPNAALRNAIFLLNVWDLSRAQCPKRTQEMWACRLCPDPHDHSGAACQRGAHVESLILCSVSHLCD